MSFNYATSGQPKVCPSDNTSLGLKNHVNNPEKPDFLPFPHPQPPKIKGFHVKVDVKDNKWKMRTSEGRVSHIILLSSVAYGILLFMESN